MSDDKDALATRHRQAYDNAVEVRDGLHAGVIAEANARRDEVHEAIEALQTGRLSAREARSGLRDIMADHGRLMEKHGGIEASEDGLADLHGKDPAEYQTDMLRRFPHLSQASNPEFTALIGEPGRASGARVNAAGVVQHVDRAQLDADQDALVRALGGGRSTGSEMRR